MRVLLIEDEKGLVLTLSDLLRAECYEVVASGDGKEGAQLAITGRFDLIILDVMLPGMGGFEVCRTIRQEGMDVPILILSAKTLVVDRVSGLRLGADDYLTKPFHPSELLARVESLLRRIHREKLPQAIRFQFGDVSIDFEKAVVIKGDVVLDFAGKELQLLRFLIDNRGKVVSREQILKEVWAYKPDVSTRTIDVHIGWLRQKLEENPQFPKHIVTVRGTGYRFSV
jgi:two-component system, OmpR family, alkaline phosphatase synthesis response regulator PhoP